MSALAKIGKSKNGCEVFVDLETSHAATHFQDSPLLFDAVKKTLPLIELDGEKIRIEIDTGEVVGVSDLVETHPGDEIVYAMRPHRDRYSRFVKNRLAEETSWIVLSLERLNQEQFKLYTAFAGRLTPSFPGGDFMPEHSNEFWSKHALVWGNQDVIPGSETNSCPW
jgi:hypothetical protein